MKILRRGLPAALAIVVALAPGDARAQRQFQLYATINDTAGIPASTVQPADLRVLENGVEAKVLKVEGVSLPVKLQLLLDNGAGFGSENFAHLRNGVLGFLAGLPPEIEVTVVSTAPQPRFLVRPTTDRQAIEKGLALLAPDNGVGRFAEALNEATQRIERDRDDYVPVIVAFATTAGDLRVRDRDVEQMFKRLEARPTTVHVVLYSLIGARSAAGGSNQTEIGTAATGMSGGRFETIAAPNRLATLLPEIGVQVAEAHARQTRQFRITVERPAGAIGEPRNVSMAALGELIVGSVSFDGRITK